MGLWRKGAREGSTKGAETQHPQAAKRSRVCVGLGLSSVPAQGPSTVQVAAGGPDEKDGSQVPPGLCSQHSRRRFTQAQAGQADVGHQNSRKAQGVKTGHLRVAIWRTTAWGHTGCDWGGGGRALTGDGGRPGSSADPCGLSHLGTRKGWAGPGAPATHLGASQVPTQSTASGWWPPVPPSSNDKGGRGAGPCPAWTEA